MGAQSHHINAPYFIKLRGHSPNTQLALIILIGTELDATNSRIGGLEGKESSRRIANIRVIVRRTIREQIVIDGQSGPSPAKVLWPRARRKRVRVLHGNGNGAVDIDVEVLATWDFTIGSKGADKCLLSSIWALRGLIAGKRAIGCNGSLEDIKVIHLSTIVQTIIRSVDSQSVWTG